jgi:PAS domain-containing protein
MYANRASLDYLGMSLEEWRRRGGIGDEVHPDDVERVKTELERALSTGSAAEIEQRVRTRDTGFSERLEASDACGSWARVYIDAAFAGTWPATVTNRDRRIDSRGPFP